MTRLKAFVARHSVATYFSLTFMISWGGVLAAIGGSGGMRGTTPASDPRFMYAVMAMLLGPSLTGILLTAFLHGKAGIREFLSRLLKWRVGASRYALALLTVPLLMIATLFALSLVSPTFFPGVLASDDKASLLLVSLAVGLAAGTFEEVGWTGFAIPTLRRRHGVIATGLIVGIGWSAWHLLPNVWSAQAAAGDLKVSIYLIATAVGVFVGYLTAFRVFMVWVYELTESLFLGMLMHVSFTASLLTLNPLNLAGQHLQVYSFVLAGSVWIVVAIVAAVNSGRLRVVRDYVGWRSVRADHAERTRPLPGDNFIFQPVGILTHAISIGGAPEAVWPWLIQMGAGSRAGWYSYDLLDNGRHPSATRIVPELQHITIGTVFPALPGVTEGFTVLALEPCRSLILGWPDLNGKPLVTWAFVLEHGADDSTRLIVRASGAQGYRFHCLPRWLSLLVARFAHFVMQRKQLLGIARRVEPSRETGSQGTSLSEPERHHG